MPVCTEPLHQSDPLVLADGAGGAFIVWPDLRDSSTSSTDIYAQHLSAEGVPLWSPGGVPVCREPGYQANPQVAPDGQGGVIVAWEDRRDLFSDVYAQRVTSAGELAWPPEGVRLRNSSNDKYFYGLRARTAIATDGVGGAIAVWEERITGTNTNLYAQRIAANGTLRWSALGRGVCSAPGFQSHSTIVADGRGGAIISWEDWREFSVAHIYAQRVDSAGLPYWPIDGIIVSAPTGNDLDPSITSDGGGGAIIAWMVNGPADIFVQRVTIDGVRWSDEGINICPVPGRQQFPTIASNESGGAIVAWLDSRGSLYEIYAQSVDSSGTTLWLQNGVPVCTQESIRGEGYLVSDGAGGAFVTWADFRPGAEGVYVQHVDATGAPLLPVDGIVVTGDPIPAASPAIAKDGAGGVIMAWADNRDGPTDELGFPINLDIYAARLTIPGLVDVPRRTTPDFKLLPARPNPTRAETVIPFNLPTEVTVDLEVFSPLGQRVRTLARSQRFAPGDQALTWNGRSDDGQLAPPGVYLVRMAVGRQSVVGRIVLLR